MQKLYRLPESIKPLLLPAMLIYLTMLCLLPAFQHDYDSFCWTNWTIQLKQHGLVSAYDHSSTINYPPLYLYILKEFGYFFSSGQIADHIHWLKSVTLLFDMAAILLLCSMVKMKSDHLKFLLFGIFNIGFYYNTMIWNQVDGILAFFLFASFYFSIQSRILFSVLLYVLGLNFKLQAIIFAPVLIAMWLPGLNARRIAGIVAAAILLQVLIVMPFLINGNAKNIVKVIFGSVDYFRVVSMNAFNFWHILLDGDLMVMPDNVPLFLGFTYKSIGLTLFCIFATMICLPLYIQLYKISISKTAKGFDLKLLLISMSLMCYVFFFFNTQMHERYIHAIIIFLTALAFLYRHWVIWILVSLNYAFSLEVICRYFRFLPDDYNELYPDLIAWLYLSGLVLLLTHWYKALPPNAFRLKGEQVKV